MQLPKPVQTILQRLNRDGCTAWAVGGCVRDSLRGETPYDWDIATSALPEQVQKLFPDCRTLPTGLAHGTVTVLLQGGSYEVTTYRVESGYTDHRHAGKVKFVEDITADLARRDLTINAMAAGLDDAFLDPFGGRADLAARCIRCVGEPTARFNEDALRVLRALRFASRLDFALEENTARAVRTCAPLLVNVSAERIFSELDKLLMGRAADRIVAAYAPELGVVIPEILPCIGFDQHNPHHLADVWGHTALALATAPRERVVRWALLLHDIAKPRCFSVDAEGIGHFYGHDPRSAAMARTILNRLKAPRSLIDSVCALIAVHDAALPQTPEGARRWLNRYGPVQLRRLLKIKRCDCNAHRKTEKILGFLASTEQFAQLVEAEIRAGSCYTLSMLAVNGQDMEHLGCHPGPLMGKTLRALLEQVIEGALPNEKEALLLAAEQYLESEDESTGNP